MAKFTYEYVCLLTIFMWYQIPKKLCTPVLIVSLFIHSHEAASAVTIIFLENTRYLKRIHLHIRHAPLRHSKIKCSWGKNFDFVLSQIIGCVDFGFY